MSAVANIRHKIGLHKIKRGERMNSNCFYYESKESKPHTPPFFFMWKLLPWLLILAGVILTIVLIRAESLLLKMLPFFISVAGVFLLMIQRMMHPSRSRRYMMVLDEEGKVYVIDVMAFPFLSSFGLEKYRMVYRAGSVGRQLSGELQNNKNYKAILDFIYSHRVCELLSQSPRLGATAVSKITSIWKGSYYFTISYRTEDSDKTLSARFYNDIPNYERLFEKCKMMYDSVDHKEEKNKVLIGILCIAAAAVLLPVTMVLATYSTSIPLNVCMLIAVLFVFSIGATMISKR